MTLYVTATFPMGSRSEEAAAAAPVVHALVPAPRAATELGLPAAGAVEHHGAHAQQVDTAGRACPLGHRRAKLGYNYKPWRPSGFHPGRGAPVSWPAHKVYVGMAFCRPSACRRGPCGPVAQLGRTRPWHVPRKSNRLLTDPLGGRGRNRLVRGSNKPEANAPGLETPRGPAAASARVRTKQFGEVPPCASTSSSTVMSLSITSWPSTRGSASSTSSRSRRSSSRRSCAPTASSRSWSSSTAPSPRGGSSRSSGRASRRGTPWPTAWSGRGADARPRRRVLQGTLDREPPHRELQRLPPDDRPPREPDAAHRGQPAFQPGGRSPRRLQARRGPHPGRRHRDPHP